MKRLLLLLAVLCAALAWALFNGSALVSLHKRWWTLGETYEIGYPLMGIGLYWVFIHRARLRAALITPSWLGALLFAGALIASAAGRVMQLQVLQQLMVPISLWCGLFALLGWRLAAQLLLPCSLIVAAVPVWDFLVGPLRFMTVAAVQGLLTRIDIPALVQGYQVLLPGGVMLIEDACSGLNLLLAALVLSTLHAELNLQSTSRKLLVIGLGIAIGIIDNWLRVFVLVVIAYASDMKSSLVHDHVIFGWWLFVGSLVPFFFIARVIERGDTRPVAPLSDVSSSAILSPVTSSAASPITLPNESKRATSESLAIPRPIAGRVATAALVLALLSSGLYALLDRWENYGAAEVVGFIAPASAVALNDGWLPQYSGYDVAHTWRFVESGFNYELTALTYFRQQPDRKLIYYTNRIAAEKNTKQRATLEVAPHTTINATVIRDRDGKGRIVWWFYWIDNAVASNAVAAKFLQLKAVLAGDRSAALIAVSRVCLTTDCRIERQEMTNESPLKSTTDIKRIFQSLMAAQKSAAHNDRSNPAG